MAANILNKIVSNRKKEVEKGKKALPLEKILESLVSAPPSRPFKPVLTTGRGLSLIAELKKASPSKGSLVAKWDPKGIAKTYYENGARAISVVTEEKHFKGSLDTIAIVKKAVPLPVLRKDFIIDPWQVYESRYHRADALLLITSLFTQTKDLRKMIQLTQNMSMLPLVEVSTPDELRKAVRAEAMYIGINNRNLSTFKVDIKTTLKLMKKVPEDVIFVSESGIFGREEAQQVFDAGVKAILVGEALLKSKKRPALVQELASVGVDY